MDFISDIIKNFLALDWALLLFFSVFCVLGFVRGFVYEILSIIGWVVSLYFAIQAPLWLKKPLGGLIEVGALSGGIVFFIALILFLYIASAITKRIIEQIKEITRGFFHRIGGASLGIVRCSIIISLLYLGYSYKTAPQEQGDWKGDIYFTRLLQGGASLLTSIFPFETLRFEVPDFDAPAPELNPKLEDAKDRTKDILP